MLALLALAGCSADGIHSPQKFFPGSQRTSWNECGKFDAGGTGIAICATTGLMPGETSPSYNIQFTLPRPVHVRIDVYNENAQFVRTVFDADEPATLDGSFRVPPSPWDFTDAQGNRVPAGDYRLYFQAEDFTSTSDVAVSE